jgi:hypothetical protein
MSFFDEFIYKVKTGKLFAGLKKEDEKMDLQDTDRESKEEIHVEEPQGNEPAIKEKASGIPRSVKKQIGPDVVIHFIFMGKTYVVENFNLNFRQDVNILKNRPDSFTYGGVMQITLSGFLDPTLDGWLTQTYQSREGEIRFFPNMPKITDSALLSIFFTEGYCTACNKTIDVSTSGVLTTITISPRSIKIGNEEFTNRWKVKEALSFTIKSV